MDCRISPQLCQPKHRPRVHSEMGAKGDKLEGVEG
jgi:hypothetical protein